MSYSKAIMHHIQHPMRFYPQMLLERLQHSPDGGAENAGPENARLENDGRKCKAGKSKTGK